jgi:hypothetical protein
LGSFGSFSLASASQDRAAFGRVDRPSNLRGCANRFIFLPHGLRVFQDFCGSRVGLAFRPRSLRTVRNCFTWRSRGLEFVGQQSVNHCVLTLCSAVHETVGICARDAQRDRGGRRAGGKGAGLSRAGLSVQQEPGQWGMLARSRGTALTTGAEKMFSEPDATPRPISATPDAFLRQPAATQTRHGNARTNSAPPSPSARVMSDLQAMLP